MDPQHLYDTRFIEHVPLWLTYLLSVAIVLLSIKFGMLVGRIRRKQAGEAAEGPLGAVVGATLGLLAFMLAFTFGIAVTRRDTKRDLLLQEANSINTTWLRTGLIPEPHRSEIRNLLRQYVDLRIDTHGHMDKVHDALIAAQEIQKKLWSHTEAMADMNLKNPDIASLFVDSLNETINLQNQRVAVSFYYIPGMIWAALSILTVVSMAIVGYHFGLNGRASWSINLGLALSFSVVILLIADLDRVSSQWLSIGREPMLELHERLHKAPSL